MPSLHRTYESSQTVTPQWTAVDQPLAADDDTARSTQSPSSFLITQLSDPATQTNNSMSNGRVFFDAVRDAVRVNEETTNVLTVPSARIPVKTESGSTSVGLSTDRAVAPGWEEYSDQTLRNAASARGRRSEKENREIARAVRLARVFDDKMFLDRSCRPVLAKPNSSTTNFLVELAHYVRGVPDRVTFNSNTFSDNATTMVPVLRSANSKQLCVVFKPLFTVLQADQEMRPLTPRSTNAQEPRLTLRLRKNAIMRACHARKRARALIDKASREFEEVNRDLVAEYRRTNWQSCGELEEGDGDSEVVEE